MKDNKKLILMIVIFSLCVFLIVSIICQKAFVRKEKPINEEEIPPITEEYEAVSFLSLYKTQGNESFYYDSYENQVLYTKSDYSRYIIGEYGKIYDTPIKEYNDYDDYTLLDNEYRHCGNIRIFYDSEEDTYYYRNPITLEDSKKYTYIEPIYRYDKDECNYILLQNVTFKDGDESTYKSYIYSVSTGKTYAFGDEIINVFFNGVSYSDSGYNNDINDTSILVKDNSGNYGIADYKTNIVLEPKYEDMSLGYNNTFLVKYNGKYGLIDKYDNILIPIKYDSIESFEDYYTISQNGKIAVLDTKFKKIIDFSIEYQAGNEFYLNPCCDPNFGYYSYEYDGLLYISTYPLNSEGYQTSFGTSDEKIIKYLNNYVINTEGLISKINGESTGENDDYYVYVTKSGRIFTFSFYDKNYKYKVAYSLVSDADYKDYYVDAYNVTSTNNNYSISVRQGDKLIAKEYVNPDNRTTITEDEAYRQYFKNGYSFSIKDKKLSVYKNTELIGEYPDITYATYLGNYMFIVNAKSYEEIIKLKFN